MNQIDQTDTVIALSSWRRRAIFALLLACEFLYGWAWNTVDVLRPLLRASLHLSLLQAGSSYSAQGAGALVGAIMAGQLADRFSRRHVLALMVSGYGAALLAGIAVGSYPALLAQRFSLGFFAGGYFPVSVAIYVTLFPTRLCGRLAGTLNVAFSGSIILLGLAMGLVTGGDWHALLWLGGVPALALAACITLIIPATPRPAARGRALPMAELFSPGLRRQTLMLAAMTGLNFFGYQAFSGWLTTYLTEVRGLSPAVAGNLLAWQFAGNICGGFLWGWAADRFGRRFNAIGFFIAAAAIAVFLTVPMSLPVLRANGFLYGATLCSSVIWGPWMAELYPPHLRSTAASIFNWGRIISFFAPLVTAWIAGSLGLAAAMLSASLSFSLAAILWLLQRETLTRRN
jgi:MFS family permease